MQLTISLIAQSLAHRLAISSEEVGSKLHFCIYGLAVSRKTLYTCSIVQGIAGNAAAGEVASSSKEKFAYRIYKTMGVQDTNACSASLVYPLGLQQST